jgi:hypothetical protein
MRLMALSRIQERVRLKDEAYGLAGRSESGYSTKVRSALRLSVMVLATSVYLNIYGRSKR